ncbi:MAG TPA: response regulator FixJ [Vineibacter sp.]|nr:response regulator FixJ [Vineibacter sp.]
MSNEPWVYVVDDDEAICDSVHALLAVTGFQVKSFTSAQDFMAAVGGAQTGCLLADVRMPDMSGLELQALVGRSCPGLAVVIMTGHGDIPMAVQAMKAGAVDFIEKPFAKDALLAAVRRAIDQSSRHGRQAAEREAEAAKVGSLSVRERQVLAGLVAGQANKVIAHRLQISPRTVEIYRARLMDKMHANSLPELVRMAVAAGVNPE